MPINVCVCGAAGGIGQPLCLLLMKSLPAGATLSMYDIAGTEGVAADLSHVDTAVRVKWATGKIPVTVGDPELARISQGVDVFVIVAGVPRKPGMSRDDLFNVNAGICHDIVATAARIAPKAAYLIVTNPVNSTVPIAAQVLKKLGVYNKNKLLGVSLLDVLRATRFVDNSRQPYLSKAPVPVVGGHSDVTIVPLLSQIEGPPLKVDDRTSIAKQVQVAGTAVVNAKAGKGSATLSMAEAGARFTMQVVDALLGKARIHTFAYVDTDGTEALPFLALPITLGPGGIEKRHPVGKMNAEEALMLKEAKGIIAKNIERGEAFARSRL